MPNYCYMGHFKTLSHAESQNPVSASAMLTGKFLQIWKVFATSSLLAEEFPDMQNVQMNWKVSGRS